MEPILFCQCSVVFDGRLIPIVLSEYRVDRAGEVLPILGILHIDAGLRTLHYEFPEEHVLRRALRFEQRRAAVPGKISAADRHGRRRG